MRNVPYFNFPEFDRVTAELRAMFPKALIFNPAEKDREMHGAEVQNSPTGSLDAIGHTGFNLRVALLMDITWIAQNADAICTITGRHHDSEKLLTWEDSSGGRAEVAFARATGIPVYTLDEMRELAQ